MTVISEIQDGKYDDNLDSISDAIRNRRDLIASRGLYTMSVGNRIRFTNQVRPTYLQGAEGTVTEIRRKRVVVKLDHPVGRFYGGIIAYPGHIERI